MRHEAEQFEFPLRQGELFPDRDEFAPGDRVLICTYRPRWRHLAPNPHLQGTVLSWTMFFLLGRYDPKHLSVLDLENEDLVPVLLPINLMQSRLCGASGEIAQLFHAQRLSKGY